MLHLVCTLLLLLIPPASACEIEMDRPVYTRHQILSIALTQFKGFTDRHFEVFHRQGLPELERLAAENDLTIAQMLEDLQTSLHLILELTGESSEQLDLKLINLRSHLNGLERVVRLPKLKANHYARLRSAMGTLVPMSFAVAMAHLDQDGITHINPYAPITATYVRDLLSAADDGVLDHALIEMAQLNKRHAEDVAFYKSISGRRVAVTPPEEVAAEVEPEPPGSDVPVEPTPAPLAELDDHDLASLLKSQIPLRPDHVYAAHTSRGVTFDVTLSPLLLKQHDDGDGPAIRRLLRSILIGRRHAGIQILHGRGEGVIEIKAMVHGHKRIFGCLEGRSLRLIRLINIKADSSAYARHLGRNFCR